MATSVLFEQQEKASKSSEMLKPPLAFFKPMKPLAAVVASPASMRLSAPTTPQSELSDCSFVHLQGIPENSAYFCAASAIDLNVSYQVHHLTLTARRKVQLDWCF